MLLEPFFKAYRFVRDFFLTKESALKVAVFRIAFGIALLITELLWLPNLQAYFSDSGYFPSNLIQGQLGPLYISVLHYVYSPSAINLIFAFLMVATVLFIFGIWSRPLSVLIWILLLSFEHRDLLVTYGGDRLLRILAFYVMFLRTDAALVPKFARPSQENWSPGVPGWPMRLIQVQIAMVYLFTAILKLRDPLWIAGTAVYWTMNNLNFGLFNFLWLGHYGWLVNLATFGTIAVELSFAFLIWRSSTRRPMLLAGALIHVGIMFTMNVILFSQIMLLLYVAFLTEDDLRWAVRFLRTTGRRIRTGARRRSRTLTRA
jgi:hypothetical protein